MENGTLVSNVTGGAVYRIATVEDVKAYFDAGFTFISGDDADLYGGDYPIGDFIVEFHRTN